jgi:hypothetical protein
LIGHAPPLAVTAAAAGDHDEDDDCYASLAIQNEVEDWARSIVSCDSLGIMVSRFHSIACGMTHDYGCPHHGTAAAPLLMLVPGRAARLDPPHVVPDHRCSSWGSCELKNGFNCCLDAVSCRRCGGPRCFARRVRHAEGVGAADGGVSRVTCDA